MDTFKHNLGAMVFIKASYEQGEVIGRAEYTNSEPTYLVRYKDGTGCAVEKWWSESALQR